LILLDVMLPKMDGYDVCTALRKSACRRRSSCSPRGRTKRKRELGLDSGADDYVTKPFSLRELRARIRAQLRRSERYAERRVQFGDCEVDFDRAELRRAGARVEITPTELRLLEVLLRNRGRVLTRAQLIDAAWGDGVAITDRAVDTQVFNLRKKIEPVAGEPRFLLGVRGLGYRFADEN
jgi:DNA-binding response OmpR family regulator